jgi:hypothetical protein
MAVVGFALALPPPVQAETFDCGAGDVQCLIAAINQANANGQENTIRLEAGIYTLTDVDNDTNGPNGLPSITSPLRIGGAGGDTTIVARDSSAPAFRLLHVGPTGNLTVDEMTLTGGFARPGGGLVNNGGVVTITLSTVRGNPGGGLLNNGGVVTMTESIVSDNGGGGTDFGGLRNNGGVVTITGSIVAGNNGGLGGGLLNNGGEVNITQCTFASNHGNGPGGLTTSGTGSTVRITQSRFTHNVGGQLAGGLLASGGTVFIANSTFDHNAAEGAGAIFADSSALVVTDSAFVENASILAGSGAGMNVNGTTIVTNTTFAGNMFEGFQGNVGVEAILNRGTLILTNSTLADNVNSQLFNPRTASALLSRPNATTILMNTLLARNTGPFSQDCGGPVISFGNNLIGDPTGCTINLQPTDLTGDPGLSTFQDNGEPGNGHVPLSATSPAIGAGNDDVCPRTDQLGRERTAPCDIGAVAFIEGEGAPTAHAVAATVHTEMSGLIASLAQAVGTLKSATGATADIFNQIKLVIDRAGDLAARVSSFSSK